jgi:osmotically-inducible protein OsmY
MKFNFIFILLQFATAMLFNACSTQDTTKVANNLTAPYLTATDNQQYDDENLRHKLEVKLKDQIDQGEIYVMVTNNDVLLVGQVKTKDEIELATAIAKSIPSTNKVFNYLTISANPKLNLDFSTAKLISKRLKKQIDIQGNAIKVLAGDNVVYLMGTNIGNLNATAAAIKGLHSLDGVDKVVNLIQKGPEDYYVEQ